jgi:hypothetical protein
VDLNEAAKVTAEAQTMLFGFGTRRTHHLSI